MSYLDLEVGAPALTEEDMKALESLSEEVNGYFVVFVQMDNARPHVKRKTHLEVAGKRRKRINGEANAADQICVTTGQLTGHQLERSLLL